MDEQENDFLFEHILKLSQEADQDNGQPLRINMITDLCHWAAKEQGLLREKLKLGDSVLLIGSCSPRAIVSLLNYAGVQIEDSNVVDFINYRNVSSSPIISRVKSMIEDSEGVELNHLSLDCEPVNLAWYPVIDSKLCINCRQCENFCLFGVYKFVNENVAVDKPTKCKPYCPACSKICPKSAVIFPKHDSAVISGNELRKDEPADQTISKMSGTELMTFLRNRSSAADKAKELGIPDKVINDMSPEQISKIVKDRK